MLEMALVLPILILLLFGIVAFSRGYNAKTELTGAVREGARELALGKDSAEVEAVTRDAAPGLTLTSVTVGAACPDDGVGKAVVTATYKLDYDIPLFDSGTWTISSKGVMRCGL